MEESIFKSRGANDYSGKKSESSESDCDIDRLHATIEKLKVENDFLQNAWNNIKK